MTIASTNRIFQLPIVAGYYSSFRNRQFKEITVQNSILVTSVIFLGDFREEVILGSKDYSSIYIFSTNWMTNNRLRHLMTDHTYDMSQAMQNIGYNQGTNLGYYVGAETLK